MMGKKNITILFLLLLISPLNVSADDDDGIQMYPDGGYGMDIGGGYEMMSDNEFLPPAGYRDSYRSSPYGPMTKKGFILFPGFKFLYERSREAKEKEKEEPVQDYIFHESTTNPSGSMLWGVSGP